MRCPSLRELEDNPELFLELVEKLGLKPRDLGITSNYLYKIRKGLKRPSRILLEKVVMLCSEKINSVMVAGVGGMVAGGGFEPPTSGL